MDEVVTTTLSAIEMKLQNIDNSLNVIVMICLLAVALTIVKFIRRSADVG